MTLLIILLFNYGITRSDCGHFNQNVPEFVLIEDLKEDIGKCEHMWSFYGDFSDDLEKMAKEDWISFRFTCTVE